MSAPIVYYFIMFGLYKWKVDYVGNSRRKKKIQKPQPGTLSPIKTNTKQANKARIITIGTASTSDGKQLLLASNALRNIICLFHSEGRFVNSNNRETVNCIPSNLPLPLPVTYR
jgi:hypothetical protein